MSSYLSEQRLACLGCYLKEVESGVDKVAAWKAHKERMRAPATAPLRLSVFWLITLPR